MAKAKAVVFDMDGTILDTLGDLATSVNYALAQHGFPTRTVKEIRSYLGNGPANLIMQSCPAGTDEATVAAVLAAAFRQGYLRRGLGSDVICTLGAMLFYELAVFATGVFLELTYPGRWGVFVMTALVSTAAAALVYQPLKTIGSIGGNLWKE